MKRQFQRTVTVIDGVITVLLFDPSEKERIVPLNVVLDLDESNDPVGLEIIGFRDQLGAAVTEFVPDLLDESRGIRFGYDSDSDAASIGLPIGSGARLSRSVAITASAKLDERGRPISIQFVVP